MKLMCCSDPCGAGKTKHMIERIARQAGKYVVAVDRRNLIDERKRSIEAEAAQVGTFPVVRPIFSKERGEEEQVAYDAQANVRRQIAAAPKDFALLEHVILLVTHEGLKQSDLRGFSGWTLFIDEVPEVWDTATLTTPSLSANFAANYRLLPTDDANWRRVEARVNAITTADLTHDDVMAPFALFHKRVTGQGVFTDLSDWKDMADRNRPWTWWSLWSPLELSAFDEVTILGNSFFESITYLLWRERFGDEVTFEPFTVARNAVPSKPKTVTIRYAARHVAGTYFWTKSAPDGGQSGAECVTAWGRWIAASTDENHLWTCNNALKSMLAHVGIKGHQVTPKIAGSNAYRTITTCSVIYSAKSNPKESKVLSLLGITPEWVQRAREFEDLIQFVLRTALRDPDYEGMVTVNVYDQTQADFLAAYLAKVFGFTVTTEYVDIGIGDVVKPSRGRGPVHATDAERRAHRQAANREAQQKRRAAARKEAEVTGTRRPRGRPKKTA